MYKEKILNGKDKIQYVIGPPGWSHDGSRLTSEQLRMKETGEDANKDAAYNAQVT
jgi:hypothetical protein